MEQLEREFWELVSRTPDLQKCGWTIVPRLPRGTIPRIRKEDPELADKVEKAMRRLHAKERAKVAAQERRERGVCRIYSNSVTDAINTPGELHDLVKRTDAAVAVPQVHETQTKISTECELMISETVRTAMQENPDFGVVFSWLVFRLKNEMPFRAKWSLNECYTIAFTESELSDWFKQKAETTHALLFGGDFVRKGQRPDKGKNEPSGGALRALASVLMKWRDDGIAGPLFSFFPDARRIDWGDELDLSRFGKNQVPIAVRFSPEVCYFVNYKMNPSPMPYCWWGLKSTRWVKAAALLVASYLAKNENNRDIVRLSMRSFLKYAGIDWERTKPTRRRQLVMDPVGRALQEMECEEVGEIRCQVANRPGNILPGEMKPLEFIGSFIVFKRHKLLA